MCTQTESVSIISGSFHLQFFYFETNLCYTLNLYLFRLCFFGLYICLSTPLRKFYCQQSFHYHIVKEFDSFLGWVLGFFSEKKLLLVCLRGVITPCETIVSKSLIALGRMLFILGLVG